MDFALLGELVGLSIDDLYLNIAEEHGPYKPLLVLPALVRNLHLTQQLVDQVQHWLVVVVQVRVSQQQPEVTDRVISVSQRESLVLTELVVVVVDQRIFNLLHKLSLIAVTPFIKLLFQNDRVRTSLLRH